MTENPYFLTIEQIQRFLPHRPPFLLVDRILGIHPTGDVSDMSSKGKVGTRVVGLKAVSFNESYFQGHFPGHAILPGVLLLETMAQISSFSLYPYLSRQPDGIETLAKNFQCVFVGVDSARFRRPVVPGDLLKIETTVTKTRGRLWVFECHATVDGQRVAEADIMANLIANSDLEGSK
ncbi:3-hydroxyacyl-ACP dehydratase FabZ [Bdellovibrionota bacterium FG-1]